MVDNIILEYDGTTVTIQTTSIEEIKSKQITPIPFPSSKSNWKKGGGSGNPKDVRILDLQRINTVFNVDGWIAQGDIANFRNIFDDGGTCNMTYVNYSASPISINMDKYSIKDDAKDVTRESTDTNPSHFKIRFSAYAGVDL